MKIHIPIETDHENIIESLNEQSYENMIQFVKDLDMRVADWQFTIDLFKYFAREVLKGDSEIIDETDGKTFDQLIDEIKNGE